MTVNLNSLCITNYDSKKDDDVKFLDELKRDEEISKSIKDAPLSLEKSSGVSNLRLGIAYLVKEKESLIGLVKLADKNSQLHALSIDIAIRSDFRNQGYGELIFTEISDYIFRNSSLIKDVKLSNCIDSNESKKKMSLHK